MKKNDYSLIGVILKRKTKTMMNQRQINKLNDFWDMFIHRRVEKFFICPVVI